MEVSRRNFLKATAVGAGLSLAGYGFNVPSVQAAVKGWKLENANEYTSICTFCACGCGMVGYIKDGKMINLEGNSDHIVNEGGLCSKGASMSVVPNSENRLKTPKYRAPYSEEWVDISWDEALSKTAAAIKKHRDENWIENETIDGKTYKVNRCDAISFVGGAQVHNEECYLMTKMTRMLGVSYLEHQARLCHSATVPALSTAFGRGAMTNTWQDIKNAKVILIEGSNAAENHPMSAKWILRAKDQGAIIIHVDPRFNRTSKLADHFFQIRPGTDIAFLGAIINYVLENNKFDEEYLVTHTNAEYLISPEYSFDDGIFSGFNDITNSYDKSKWGYQLDSTGKPMKATLNHKDSVLSHLREFYKRYDLQTASSITGIPAEDIKKVAELYSSIQPGTIMYSLGMTQHTVGVQNIRSFSVLQLLLGNVGKPGTGINALRGEPNVQGSTDFALLFNYFPGYLNTPKHTQQTFKQWCDATGTMRSAYMVSLMKAWFGENANESNEFGYQYMPKINSKDNYSIYRIFETAIEKKMKFLYIMGQNPLVTSPNLHVVQKGLEGLETLVVADPFETETAAFWQRREGVDPKTIATEVILLPAASFLEKEGTLINASRLVQWRYKELPNVGDSRADIDIIDEIFVKLRDLYKDSTEAKDQVFKAAKWDYSHAKSKSDEVLKEINGYNLKTGKPLNGIGDIKGDGSTSTGCWLYAGVYANGENQTLRQDSVTDPGGLGIFPKFAYTWPNNIHILYNRASCDKNGKTFKNVEKPIVWWDENEKKWTGYDIPDVPKVTDGPDTPNGQKPFRMSGEGVGRLFGAYYKDEVNGQPRDYSYVPGDGPLPEFYEPVESPTINILHKDVSANPCLVYPRLEGYHPIGDNKKFPYVLCTSAVSEHWCSGAYTRNVPWLNELMKETYIEMPTTLAEKLSVKNGDRVAVNSARGEIEVKVMVTNRINTLKINGEDTTVVWMPYNWGFKGLSTAASTNLLTIDAGDPNTWIQETKACLVNVRKAGA